MSRLPYPDPSTAGAEVTEALARLPVELNVFRMTAHAESAFIPWLRFGAALLSQLELDPVLRELAVLEVARLSPSRYEWVQHEAIARALGVPDDDVAALARGDAAALGAPGRAVVEFTRAVVRDVRAGDEALAALRGVISERAVVELLLVVGHYMTIARLAETTGIEVDAPVDLAVVHAAGRETGGA